MLYVTKTNSDKNWNYILASKRWKWKKKKLNNILGVKSDFNSQKILPLNYNDNKDSQKIKDVSVTTVCEKKKTNMYVSYAQRSGGYTNKRD